MKFRRTMAEKRENNATEVGPNEELVETAIFLGRQSVTLLIKYDI